MTFLDLINDEEITDIKATSFDSVNVKYKDGVIKRGIVLDDFSTQDEYESFVGDMLREKKGVMLKDAFVEHFWDDTPDNCMLKVSVTGVSASLGGVYISIRKLPKPKMG